jgi:hypothetical protein
VYSFGCTLHAMVRHPCSPLMTGADRVADLFEVNALPAMRLAQPRCPLPGSAEPPGLPPLCLQLPMWRGLVQRCTAADPAARPSFLALAADLEALCLAAVAQPGL